MVTTSGLSGLRAAVVTLLFFLTSFASSSNVSTLYISPSQTLIAINLPPDSNDVNFYISSPNWYSYTAFGFGSVMKGSLMMIAYAGDGNQVTVSPRIATGETEPAYYSDVTVDVNEGSSSNSNSMLVVNATCRNCRSWPGGSLDVSNTTQPFIFALGSNIALATDDLSASLKRHIGYGFFTVDMVAATGPGGIGLPQPVTAGAVLTDGIINDVDSAATAHGVIFAIVALGVVPFNILATVILPNSRFINFTTSTVLLILVVCGLATGVSISREYIATQTFKTGHQVLGFVAIAIFFILFVIGIAHQQIFHWCKKRQQALPKIDASLKSTFIWGSGFIWLLFLISNGLGLQLAQQTTVFIVAYSVLAAGVVIFVVPLLFLIYYFFIRRRITKERQAAGLEIPTIYDIEHH